MLNWFMCFFVCVFVCFPRTKMNNGNSFKPNGIFILSCRCTLLKTTCDQGILQVLNQKHQ